MSSTSTNASCKVVQTSQTPTACQCLEPIVQCAGNISLLATAACGALLDLGHSHSTAHVVVSWLITRFRNRVPGCWNRVARIRLYSIFFFLNSCLLNWFLLLATECNIWLLINAANKWMNEWMKKWKLRRISFKSMFLLSLLTNKDSYNAQIIQYTKNGSGYPVLEPVLEF